MERATSFGTIAADYDRYRPAPPLEVADWLLPEEARRAADVCTGTGGFSRVLAERVEEVFAVDIDMRMLSIAASADVSAACARGEALPFRSGTLDAVTVSSGWHWLDPDRAVPEIARVLRPGGVLGVVWNGASRQLEWVRELLGRHRRPSTDGLAHPRELEIPAGQPFTEPESRVIEWSLTRTPSELIGLAGTYSRFIVLSPQERRHVARRAAELVEQHPLLKGRAHVDLPMSSRCWKSVRT